MTAMLERHDRETDPTAGPDPVIPAARGPVAESFPRTLMPAAPTSPVGRTNAALAADPAACDPLRQLEQRLGRPLLDLAGLTDRELHAVTDRLLTEKHRRAARWYDLS